MRTYLFVLLFVCCNSPLAAEPIVPTRQEAKRALDKACRFFATKVSSHGGYVWKYDDDLKYRMGEGVATKSMIWIQPPGTPSVGEAFLDAYRTTGEQFYLEAGKKAAVALVKSQLHSGGWYYSAEFDPNKRRRFMYRDRPKPEIKPLPSDYVGGWAEWRKRRYDGNITVLDDDVTSSAIRFLMHIDNALQHKHQKIHDAAIFALASVMKSQYPNGAWSHNYDRFPRVTPSRAYYPIKEAAYPRSWSRQWTKDFEGCYSINDRITPNQIKTFLAAYDVYQDKRYLNTAKRGGDFFILAQMPNPQPAWAQQYDRHMHPVWDRSFEPPAITGSESQDVLETLLLLCRKTGDDKYLKPIPKALAYLKKSKLADGRLARFYELTTNKPLYFTRDYKLTYDPSSSPTHYSFTVESRLGVIEKEYHRLMALAPADLKHPERTRQHKVTKSMARRVREVLNSQDERGAWVEKTGFVRNLQGRKVGGPVIYSSTFCENVALLCRFLRTSKE